MTAGPVSHGHTADEHRSGLTARRTFRALQVRNFRLFLSGQAISLIGTWMQFLGQAWLVYDLTGSSSTVGLTVAAQFLPVVVLAGWAGVLADRVDKRRLLVISQSAAAVAAAVLGVLTMTGVIRPWMVFVLAVVLGTITALEHPSRQTFVLEMVGPEHLLNAVTLHSVTVNLARIVGPVIAGVAIATVGIGICFLLNALSYVAVIAALVLMRTSELNPTPRQPRERGQFREGLAYVARNRQLRTPLLVMTVVSGFGYSYDVILPVLAREAFDGGAGLFAVMVTVMGVGAMIGGLATATYLGASLPIMSAVTIVFGGTLAAAGLVPFLVADLLLLFVAGGAGLVVMSLANTNVQLGAKGSMRGRVMACWSLAFQGTRPIGALVIGLVSEAAGPRTGLVVSGAAVSVAGLAALRVRSVSQPALAET